MKKLVVVSLCDGISIGRLALENLGYEVEYYRSEIKEIANKVAMDNFPDSHNLGDVTKVKYKNKILYGEFGVYKVPHVDIVMFGSPCNSFSISMKTEGRIGLNDPIRSGLFYECHRIMKEINAPHVFLENVASMKNSDRDTLTNLMGIEPIKLDAKVVLPELRNRYYWTNIPLNGELEKKDIKLNDILIDGYCPLDKARCLLVSDSRPLTTPVKMFHRFFSTGFSTLIFKSEKHYKDCVNEYIRLAGGKRKIAASELNNYDGHVFDGVRYLNQEELEKCQGFPKGYTKCLDRNGSADTCGDSWALPVIEYLFSGIETVQDYLEEVV